MDRSIELLNLQLKSIKLSAFLDDVENLLKNIKKGHATDDLNLLEIQLKFTKDAIKSLCSSVNKINLFSYKKYFNDEEFMSLVDKFESLKSKCSTEYLMKTEENFNNILKGLKSGELKNIDNIMNLLHEYSELSNFLYDLSSKVLRESTEK